MAYTEEMVTEMVEMYRPARENGALNRDILGEMETLFEKSVASLRAKLNSTPYEDAFAYLKDTEAEKEAIEAAKAAEKAAKPVKETKAVIARNIVNALGMSEDMVADLAKAKVDTLKALRVAVIALAPAEDTE